MIITDPNDCYLVTPEGLYGECREALRFGTGVFNSALHVETVSWAWAYWSAGAFFGMLALILVIAAAVNDSLTQREKTGWILGGLFAPVFFLPLYFIFSAVPPPIDFAAENGKADAEN